MTPFDTAMVGIPPRIRGEALARCAMRAGLRLQPGDEAIALEWANSSAENIEQVVAEAYGMRHPLERKACTAEEPMPAADKARYFWIHGDAVDVGPFFNLRLYTCPHCNLTFHALPRA